MGETVASATAVAAVARTPSPVVARTNSAVASGAGLPQRAGEKGGLDTPETGTPPPRSVSPSSDGGNSLPPSDPAASSEGRCCPAGGAEGSDESAAAGGSGAASSSSDGASPVKPGVTAATEDANAGTEKLADSSLQIAVVAEPEITELIMEAVPKSEVKLPEHMVIMSDDYGEQYDGEVIDPESADPPPPAAKADSPGESALAIAEGAASAAASGAAAAAASVAAPASAPSNRGEKKKAANKKWSEERKHRGDGYAKGKNSNEAIQVAAHAQAQQHAVALSAAVFAGVSLPSPADPAALGLGAGGPSSAFSDRRIIEVLAAPESAHKRLLKTAKCVPEIIRGDPEGEVLTENVELYGSLSLDMSEPEGTSGRPWRQDWATYYINGRSDVDFVVEMRKGVTPKQVADRIVAKGPWNLVGQTQVHKFASTQYTLLGNFEKEDGDAAEVYLDVTCIESPLHFTRFKSRQEAFRKVFTDVRFRMEAQFGGHGAVAFDGYIHLLKAFAAKVPGNALTGFQATCIGLFTLQIGHFRLKPMQSIALSLFEGFLRFCFVFYGDAARPANMCWKSHYHYRTCGIDLSSGGRWLPRMSLCWRSELYFMAAEAKMLTRPDERVNVVHSLDPVRVSAEAHALLTRAFLGCDMNRLPFPAADFSLGPPTAASN